MSARNVAIFGWILAAALSVAVILLTRQLDRRLATEAGIRANPAGLDTHRDIEVPTTRWLMVLGDSRAAGLGGADLPGWEILNLGIPGQTSAEILARAGRELVLLDPDALVLIGGINDLKTGEAEDAIARATRNLVDVARVAERLDIPILIVDAWPNAELGARSLLLPADLQDRCNRLAVALRRSLDGSAVQFVDIPLLGEDGHVRSELARDALRLNDAGNRILSDTIEFHLGEIVRDDS